MRRNTKKDVIKVKIKVGEGSMTPSNPSKKPAKTSAKKPAKKPPKPKERTLKERVEVLEQQVNHLIGKMNLLEAQGAKSKGLEDPRLIKEIKSTLLVLFKSGESRAFDEIYAHPSMQQYDQEDFQRAVVALVDDETFDMSEGISKLKVQGYGRLIRR